MGSGPIGWRTIAAWADAVGVKIEPWEKRLLRRLSVEYVAEGRRAESECCPAPFKGVVTAREREVEDQMLRAVLG